MSVNVSGIFYSFHSFTLIVLWHYSGCHMKCHKDDIDKSDLIQPCVAG